MNIYLVKRIDSVSYDEYDSFICTAENEINARKTYPSYTFYEHRNNHWFDTRLGNSATGCDEWIDDIKTLAIEKIGISQSKKECVILASYNAG